MPGWAAAIPALFGLRRWRSLPRYMCAVRVSRFRLTPVRGTGSPILDRHPSGASPAFAAETLCLCAGGARRRRAEACRLLNCDRNTLKLGIPVELVFRELEDGFRLPCFQPSEQVAP